MHTYGDDRGLSLMSIFDHVAELPGQFNASLMYAGAVKAWHRHALQDDHWTVLSGHLKVGLFNTESMPIIAELRLAGPVPGTAQAVPVEVSAGSGRTVFLGERRPGALRIPAHLWHGGVAIGGNSALLLYYVTRKYDAQRPDEERQPWDRFPFTWDVERR